MSVPFSGALRRSNGVFSAIGKQLKLVNLKGVKRITVTFDPFHEKAVPTRDFLFHLSTPKIVETNPLCVLKTEVVCNRAPPSVRFQLVPAAQEAASFKEVVFDSENLNTLELLQLFNKHITPLAPAEVVTSSVKTKSEKKAAGKQVRRK